MSLSFTVDHRRLTTSIYGVKWTRSVRLWSWVSYRYNLGQLFVVTKSSEGEKLIGCILSGLEAMIWKFQVDASTMFLILSWCTWQAMNQWRGAGSADGSLSKLQNFVCGLGAGLFSKLCCHPLDVVKKRYQVGPLFYQSQLGRPHSWLCWDNCLPHQFSGDAFLDLILKLVIFFMAWVWWHFHQWTVEEWTSSLLK